MGGRAPGSECVRFIIVPAGPLVASVGVALPLVALPVVACIARSPAVALVGVAVAMAALVGALLA